jgi:ABC-2 type transport system permease protein
MKWLWVLIIIVVLVRLAARFKLLPKRQKKDQSSLKPLDPRLKSLYTVWVFFTISLRRLFRDRMALFFTFLFPLIFLAVFGSLSHHDSVSLKVALINRSDHSYAKQLVEQLDKNKIIKVNKGVTTFSDANTRMSRGEIDATIELPPNFGAPKDGVPTGQAIVHYTQNNEQAAQTLVSVLQAQFQGINSKLVASKTPFTVVSQQNNEHSLSAFDYTFTGLLGFSILGAGIFGPMNVFPELKKMGILRRLRTTPLKVWQYFLANMLGNAVTGLLSIAVMFVAAILVFHLKVIGNYFELAVFLAYGIIVILGIGLALGGWAKNERQAAPLGNIIVFPMMFLTGVFFPRFLMPDWLQHVTTYMPLTPVIDGARLIATEGKSLLDLGSQLAIMTVWLVIVYIIAFRVFRWE